jgi:hypothetical protein
MNIHAVGPGIDPNISLPRKVSSVGIDPESPPKAESPPATAPTESGRAKGVIRLLQEGHFQGVADVRLRINFHDELSRLGPPSTETSTADVVRGFSSGVEEDLAQLTSALGGGEEQPATATELIDGFAAAVRALADETAGQPEPDIVTLVGSTQALADAFSTDLRTLLALDSSNAAIDEFITAFSDRLSQLEVTLLQSADLLPELSEPKGNGVAYAKFLDILNGLNAVVEEVTAPDLVTEGELRHVDSYA